MSDGVLALEENANDVEKDTHKEQRKRGMEKLCSLSINVWILTCSRTLLKKKHQMECGTS